MYSSFQHRNGDRQRTGWITVKSPIQFWNFKKYFEKNIFDCFFSLWSVQRNAYGEISFRKQSKSEVKWSAVQFSEKPQNWHKKEYCFQVRQAFKSFFVTKYFFWGGFSLLGSFYYSKKISWAKWNELPKERPVISPSNSLECSSRLYFPNIVDSSSRASKEVSRGMQVCCQSSSL